MVAIGQVALPFVDGQTIWSLDGRVLSGPRAGASVIHRLVSDVASAWGMPGAVVAAIVVVLFAALAATGGIGRVGRYLPAAAAWVASAALAVSWAAVAFEVAYSQTPRPGVGLFVSMLGALVLTLTPLLSKQHPQMRSTVTTNFSQAGIG